jgi:tetrahedral aminopeptidase
MAKSTKTTTKTATKSSPKSGLDIALLSAICEKPGVSGFEQPIRELILKSITGLADEITVDPMGNIIAIQRGKDSSQKVMVPAHMDEIGFIVTHIDNDGFVRFHTLGGFDPKTLTSQRVLIHGKNKTLLGVMGSKPIHLMSPEERGKNVAINDYFIDLGMKKEEVLKHISVGNPITRQRELVEMGDCVNCKSLDNRVSVFILIETLRKLKGKKLPYDFYGVFTVQEEIGLRGATTAAHALDPDFGICLDTTIAFDVPGNKDYDKITKLGEGTAIKIMDGSVICDYRMVEFMKQTAEKNKIKYQMEILTAGGTDTGAMQKMAKNGSICGAVSIPTRHIHQTIETCHKEDIQLSIDLLSACLQSLDTFDWSFK